LQPELLHKAATFHEVAAFIYGWQSWKQQSRSNRKIRRRSPTQRGGRANLKASAQADMSNPTAKVVVNKS
jgi:hypothetical protein